MIKYCCNCGTPVQYFDALICEYCGYSFTPVKPKEPKDDKKTVQRILAYLLHND